MSDSQAVTIRFEGSIDLMQYSFDKLPPLPEGVTPEVWFDFSDGRVETYVEHNSETVTFWSTDGDGTYNSLSDSIYGSKWEDLADEDREALLEWGKEVHERIDNATYSIMIQATTSNGARESITQYATTDLSEEEES
jgi:hypothetical protein